MQESSPGNTQETKSKKLGYAEAAALSIGLLTAAHPEAKALEVEAYTPWHIAVQDDVRRAVENDKVEHAATYVQFTDRSGEWLTTVRGELRTVQGVDARKDIRDLREYKKQREVAAVCHMHTHVKEFVRHLYGPEAGMVYNPPSVEDINYAHGTRNIYQQNFIDPNKVQFAAFDGNGAWYFAPLNLPMAGASVEPARPGSPQANKLVDTITNFRVNSGKPGFNFSAELPKLKQAYKNIGGEVRFTSFKQMQTEAPCAGVNNKAPK